jgi:hypothetical protein
MTATPPPGNHADGGRAARANRPARRAMDAPPKYPTTYYTDYMARYQQRTYDLLAAENRNAAE